MVAFAWVRKGADRKETRGRRRTSPLSGRPAPQQDEEVAKTTLSPQRLRNGNSYPFIGAVMYCTITRVILEARSDEYRPGLVRQLGT